MRAPNIIDGRRRLNPLRPQECEHVDTFTHTRATPRGLVAVFHLSERTCNRIASDFGTRVYTRSKRQLENDLADPALPEAKPAFKTRQRDEWQKALKALAPA